MSREDVIDFAKRVSEASPEKIEEAKQRLLSNHPKPELAAKLFEVFVAVAKILNENEQEP